MCAPASALANAEFLDTVQLLYSTSDCWESALNITEYCVRGKLYWKRGYCSVMLFETFVLLAPIVVAALLKEPPAELIEGFTMK